MITKSTKIYIAGHKGMVGSAIWRALEANGYNNLIGNSSKELDLRNQGQVHQFLKAMKKPAFIFDGRRILDVMKLEKIGFEAYSLGK